MEDWAPFFATPMLRPLVLDIGGFALPLLIGVGAFAAGRSLYRLPKACRIVIVALAVGFVSVGCLVLARILPIEIEGIFYWVGGTTVLFSWLALLLLGVVWSVPGRSLSSGFLAALTAVAGILLVIEASPRLWWRFGSPEAWQRTADDRGRLQQSSGTTCSPAAAVMLLHHHGIVASEGEMAYLAGTSLLGTDGHSMARALQSKVQPMGWNALVRHIDYETCVRLGQPFVAHTSGPFGGHALMVERAIPDQVDLLDPVDGERTRLSPESFKQIWDGTAIYIIRGTE